MQRGRHNDRIVLARLRVGRRWLVRDRDKAGLAPDPQPRWAMGRGPPLDDLSHTEPFFASIISRPAQHAVSHPGAVVGLVREAARLPAAAYPDHPQ
jgi:hypothetical protein